jgi:hypothetical protein
MLAMLWGNDVATEAAMLRRITGPARGMRGMRSTLMNITGITLAMLLLFAALLPLSASMDHEYFVTGACSIDGVPAQGVNIIGPYGAQTASYPGGNYSLYIRLPDGGSSFITIVASYKGYVNASKDLDLNQTTSVDFNLMPLPVTYTVSGICRANGVPAAGVTVSDETYDSHTVSGQDGTYRLNISVPGGETTWVRLVASMSGYDQDATTLDLNATRTANFNLPVVAEVTALPSPTSGPSARATAAPGNQTAAGLIDLVSANAYPVFIIIVLLIIAIVAAILYLRRRGKTSKHEMIEPSREDIYKLVTGDTKRTRRVGKEHNGGHEKLK